MIQLKQIHRALAFFIIFFIAIGVGGLYVYNITGEQIIDLKFNYSPDEVNETLSDMGEKGRDAYLYVILADLYYPLAYVTFLGLAIGYIMQRVFPPDSMLQKLMFLPLLAGGADIGENMCLAKILYAFPARLDSVALLANYFTVAKNIVLLTTIGIVLIGLIQIRKNREEDAE